MRALWCVSATPRHGGRHTRQGKHSFHVDGGAGAGRRQNYLHMGVGLALLVAVLRSWWVAAGVALAVGAAVATSTRVLGELQLWLDDTRGVGNHPFTFNELRVMSMERTRVTAVLATAAALAFSAGERERERERGRKTEKGKA
jgi:hypothetical protein